MIDMRFLLIQRLYNMIPKDITTCTRQKTMALTNPRKELRAWSEQIIKGHTCQKVKSVKDNGVKGA